MLTVVCALRGEQMGIFHQADQSEVQFAAAFGMKRLLLKVSC